MNEPICAVCGGSKVNTLFVFNYGVCLCERCMETAAHCFIKVCNTWMLVGAALGYGLQ